MSGVVTVQRATTSRPWTSASDPSVSSDSTLGVRVGDTWVNTATQNIFTCTSNATGAAVWQHQPRILGQSGAAVSCGANTTENTLATITIPANAMGANGSLLVDTTWSFTSSANNKTLIVKTSGTGGASFLAISHTTLLTARHLTRITNRNSVSIQIGMPGGKDSGLGGSAGATTVGAVDTSASTAVVITGTKASAGETLTLESYSVLLTRP
jgi:hypothetical protein